MIIKYFTDNDLYKFNTMYAIQKLYPRALVKYRFFNRDNRVFPEGFADALRQEIDKMSALRITEEELAFLRRKCYFFDPVFFDLLKGYRYNPSEVTVSQSGGKIELHIEGYWYRTVLWEVPIMAMISELYFNMTNQKAVEVEQPASRKAKELTLIGAKFSDFGTRRRFSFDVHDRVLGILKRDSNGMLTGSSNVYLAMKHGLTPIGTHPHEWFMYHAAHYGYRSANAKALDAWTQVYNGALGIALTDTFTTDNFFQSFALQQAKLFDGLRWDSGDPIEFTRKALSFYKKNRIDTKTKTIVYSDSLSLDKIKEIKEFVDGRFIDVYGIGTYLTNDVGVNPLNMVIKLTETAVSEETEFYPAVKLSDIEGKHTGVASEIELCKQTLKL